MPECFLFLIFEKELKTTIAYVPTGTIFHVPKNMKTFFTIMVSEFVFSIIMRIYLTSNKCTVNKIRKWKIHKNILTYMKQSQYENITLITISENEGLEKENKSN